MTNYESYKIGFDNYEDLFNHKFESLEISSTDLLQLLELNKDKLYICLGKLIINGDLRLKEIQFKGIFYCDKANFKGNFSCDEANFERGFYCDEAKFAKENPEANCNKIGLKFIALKIKNIQDGLANFKTPEELAYLQGKVDTIAEMLELFKKQTNQ